MTLYNEVATATSAFPRFSSEGRLSGGEHSAYTNHASAKVIPLPRKATGGPRPAVAASEHDDRPPPGALTWSDARGRAKALHSWRLGCLRELGRSAHQLRVAWALEQLFAVKEGFAFPSNSHLAKATGLAENHVEAAITALDRAGAIIRTRLREGPTRGGRRIFPARAIAIDAPRVLGGEQPPKFRPPSSGGLKNNREQRGISAGLSREAFRARQEAERRAARERGEPVRGWLDEEAL